MHTEDLTPAQPHPDTAVAPVDAVVQLENSGAVSAHASLDGDANVPEVTESQAPAAPEKEALPAWAEPVPDVSSLSAAKDAAAFVAQIFTDPSMSDAADADVTAVAVPVDAAPAVALPPVPAQWPQDQAQHLQGRRVLILGLGASGLSMARWCVRAGAEVTVADTREAPPQLALLHSELPQARFVGGPLTSALVDGQSLNAVYRSPGLAPDVIAPVADAARAIGLPVGGELDLFAAALQGMARRMATSPSCWPSPAPTARPR